MSSITYEAILQQLLNKKDAKLNFHNKPFPPIALLAQAKEEAANGVCG